jgi:hypothetical protein
MTHATFQSGAAAAAPTLAFERRLEHPIEAVWRVITDPAELEHWFPTAVAGELAPGAPLMFEFRVPHLPVMHGEVTELEPRRRLSFTWGRARERADRRVARPLRRVPAPRPPRRRPADPLNRCRISRRRRSAT